MVILDVNVLDTFIYKIMNREALVIYCQYVLLMLVYTLKKVQLGYWLTQLIYFLKEIY